jgi:hypothetical protein
LVSNGSTCHRYVTVLHAIARMAQSPEGGGLKVSIRSTLNADNDFVYSAYSPHLVLPMVGGAVQVNESS